MKFTLAWLKDHLDTQASVDELAERLTMIGLEVESVENRAATLAPFVIARVLSAEKHPNADKLKVCMVDAGSSAPIQVVCGAPNAHAGMKGVFAPPGTHIPGTGLDLKIGNIRGVESRGMLCSAAELQLSDDHTGIIELPDEAPVGKPYAAWARLDDPVIDVAITTNRPDCLGVSGIARDLAASGLGKFREEPAPAVKGKFPCPVSVKIDLDTPVLCPAFGLRLVRGVKNGPSPDSMQRRLREVGLRPINALVDITNYLTIDRNRPLHVFDAAKVKGNLTVRRARDGEEILALDGKTYKLDPAIVVIADGNSVKSLGGVMGGEASGCTEATTDVLIESALWDPLNIAQTGRRLGINSDARNRFERGVDPAFMLPGLALATVMVMEFCGGTPSEATVAGEVPRPQNVIDFPVTEVKRLAGIDPAIADVTRILEALGFACKPHRTKGAISVTVPSWRPDIDGKADLVEEVVRIIGVDKVPSTPLPRLPGVAKPVLTLLQTRTHRARRALATRGLVEAVTWSFVPAAHADAFGGGQGELKLANPISADMSDMRPSLLPGLAAAAQRNADRGFADLALFEIGQVYRGDRPQDQFVAASGIRRGTAGVNGGGRHWSGKAASVSAFDAKADALALLDVLGLPTDKLQVATGAPDWFHPGRSGVIRLGPQNVIGAFGEFHPETLDEIGVDGPLVGFELILNSMPVPKARSTKTRPPLALSDFQPVRRDFAFLVDRTVEAAAITRAAANVDRELIARVSVFDLFEDAALGDGKKSVAIEVTLQPVKATLTEPEIEAVSGKIIAAVTKATGATLRS